MGTRPAAGFESGIDLAQGEWDIFGEVIRINTSFKFCPRRSTKGAVPFLKARN
jgi:hypothetical protein